jgi:RND superfamily putative drug exporter
MREAWDAGHDNRHAVVQGLARTGRIVTAAALIMVAVFSGFVAGSVPGLQQFGLGLALGILLDATIVRMLLVPALITLVGPSSWWLPSRLARLFRGSPSPH